MSHDHDHDHKNLVPAVPLKLAIGLVVLTLVGVIWQRAVIAPAQTAASAESPETAAQPLESRLLQFEDGQNGSVIVRSVSDGVVLNTLQSGEGGFLRGILRGLTRERRINSASREPGFLLQRFEGGRVILVDMATKSVIDLRAFGHTNAEDFLRYLPSRTAQVSAANSSTRDGG